MAGHWFSCLKNKHIKNNNKNTVESLSFDKTGKMCNIAQFFKNWLHLCRLGTRLTNQIYMCTSVCACVRTHLRELTTSLTFFHSNLNGIATYISAKMAPIQSYATSYNSDIICLSESFFDSSVGTNNPQINIPCYNIFCCDPPSDTEIGGVCISYEEHLPSLTRDDLRISANALRL